MKKYFFLSLMLFLFPIMVSASFETSLNEYNRPGDVYFKGTVLRFYNNSSVQYNRQVYLDNKSVIDDLVERSGDLFYTLPNDVVIKSFEYGYSSSYTSSTIIVYFESINLSETKVHCYIGKEQPSEVESPNGVFDKKYCDDYMELGSYYSSNDIILRYDSGVYLNYFDKNGQPVADDSYNDYRYTPASYFPKVNNKETYWAYSSDDNIGYNGHISPIFEEYVPPKFELKCSPKTIKYGEKSTCTLYGTVDVNLKNLNFDFDPKEYKVLGATFPKGIDNKKGDKQYNLEISEDFNQEEAGFVLGVFELTGAQNKKYTDDVQIINLDYVDTKVKGKYENLKDPIEIVALKESTKELKEEDNPNTASSLSVIIPVVLFVVTVVIFFAVDNKKKIKKIS